MVHTLPVGKHLGLRAWEKRGAGLCRWGNGGLLCPLQVRDRKCFSESANGWGADARGKMPSLFAKQQLNAKVSSHAAVAAPQMSRWRRSLTKLICPAAQLHLVSSANSLQCVSVVSAAWRWGCHYLLGPAGKPWCSLSQGCRECWQSTSTNYRMVPSPLKRHTETLSSTRQKCY